jgi:NAD(P)-dependent dehydrogenase (short-subunit alcohol dehydrogenase family)
MEDIFCLKGKVALVTGGSRGIGKMIASEYVKRGVKTYISARKAKACDTTAAELSAFGQCISIPADISNLAGIKALAAQMIAREPSLDILVNNAGAAWGMPFDQFSEHGWDKVMDVNLKGVFFLTQALAPLLREAGARSRASGGHASVINIASIDGLDVAHIDMETYSYSASKVLVDSCSNMFCVSCNFLQNLNLLFYLSKLLQL